MNGRIVSLLLLAMLFFSLTGVAVKGTENVWIETAPMHVERAYHTATLLKDGKVLVAGGKRNSSNSDNQVSLGTDSCELFDPYTDSWSVTGFLQDNRFGHTATLLNDGRVLAVGGRRSGQQGMASLCELYDPATGSWDLTGSLNIPRYLHTATLLADGEVVIAGGRDGGGRILLECELYDPTTGAWTLTGALNVGRYVATSTLLTSGMVLVAGGLDDSGTATSTCELYDPSTGIWRHTKPMNVARAWMENGATLLQNGSFLVTGGGDGFTTSFASCELYDPNTETWTLTGSLNAVNWGHTAIPLPNGQVLVVGWSYCEIYNPGTGAWTILAQTLYNTVMGTATLLTDGRVLAAGGIVHIEPITSCELFTRLPDLVILVDAYGSRPGDPNWNPNADLDNNGIIGLTDLVTLAIHYGQHYP